MYRRTEERKQRRRMLYISHPALPASVHCWSAPTDLSSLVRGNYWTAQGRMPRAPSKRRQTIGCQMDRPVSTVGVEHSHLWFEILESGTTTSPFILGPFLTR